MALPSFQGDFNAESAQSCHATRSSSSGERLIILVRRFAANRLQWHQKDNLWLSQNHSKRWGELFFLAYSPFWITLCLGAVVPLRLYESFGEVEFLILGVVAAPPCFVFPFFIVGHDDAKRPWYRRYWFKANLWIVIFGYVGNYFWTHYFYAMLGASYSCPSYRFNQVPVTIFLLTQPYFLLYHTISNITIRRLRHATENCPGSFNRCVLRVLWIVILAYATALVTITHFPYFSGIDREAMYKMGAFFYACYFMVSFPMFFRLDENPNSPWTLPQVAVDSLGAAMMVTMILDMWRLLIGPMVTLPWAKSYDECLHFGLPWLRPTSSAPAAAQVATLPPDNFTAAGPPDPPAPMPTLDAYSAPNDDDHSNLLALLM